MVLSYNDAIYASGQPTQSVTDITLAALAAEGFTEGSLADRTRAYLQSLTSLGPNASIADMQVELGGVPVRIVINVALFPGGGGGGSGFGLTPFGTGPFGG